MDKLKRCVIKEELVKLTGKYQTALVLNQMIYWSERVKDKDKFLMEEKTRSQMAMGRAEIEKAQLLEQIDLLSHGWIYKSASELSEETMLGVSKSTMGRYIDDLVNNKWMDKRENPHWKGDNTYQYRVNIVKVQLDLQKLGYALEGYPLQLQNETSTFDNETSQFQNETTRSKIELPVSKSNTLFQNETTLPEITPKIKTDTTHIKTLDHKPLDDLYTLNLPMPLKKWLGSKVNLLNKSKIDLYELEEFYTMCEYIKHDKERHIDFLNQIEFTALVKKLVETVVINTSTQGVLLQWVHNKLHYKKNDIVIENEVDSFEMFGGNDPIANILLNKGRTN